MSRASSPAEGRTPPPEMDPPTLPPDDAWDPSPPLVDEDPPLPPMGEDPPLPPIGEDPLLPPVDGDPAARDLKAERTLLYRRLRTLQKQIVSIISFLYIDVILIIIEGKQRKNSNRQRRSRMQ